MRIWLISLMMLVACAPVWGQNAIDQFQFVSTMYTPRGAFKEVNTTFTTEATEFTDDAQFNVGSVASEGGTIEVKGNPIVVPTLQMENNTQIESAAKWLVNSLKIGEKGTVTVNEYLIADRVYLGNSTTAMVASRLIIDSPTWTKAGKAEDRLQADGKGGGDFTFMVNDTGAVGGNATWKKIAQTAEETGKGVEPEKYYPIYKN